VKTARILIILILSGLNIYGQQVQPKNIIIMIGDGMGFEQLNASLFYQGKAKSNVWDNFPVHLAAATNHSEIDYQPLLAWNTKDYVMKGFTESAAASTAIATGIRTSDNRIGFSSAGIPLTNPVQISSTLGKSSGIVTSVPFNHATPAGFVVNNMSRMNYGEIALQMIIHSQASVIMGCGHPEFDNDGIIMPTLDFKYLYDADFWNNLQKENHFFDDEQQKYIVQDIDGDGVSDPWMFSDKRTTLEQIIDGHLKPKRLFFLAPVFATLTQTRRGDREKPWNDPVSSTIPSLTEMSMATIEILSLNQEGFFLMIEGGAIDWGGHDTNLVSLIEEQMEFEKSVEAIIQWISERDLWNETLLIVLADHECGYLTGGYVEQHGFQQIIDAGAGKIPVHQFLSTDHTNHLVPFFAKGAMSHVFDFLATDFDPVRGKYLHISDVGKTIKYFWGDHAYAYPATIHTCPDKNVTITATSPYEFCTYKWFVNEEYIQGIDSFIFEMNLIENAEVFCEISCHKNIFRTNIVKVMIAAM
jgi:alkaline phosphatase